MHPEIKIFYWHKTQKSQVKKFLPPFHTQLKLWNLDRWWKIHSLTVPQRNKNFSTHTPWVKNFLLSQNSNFSTKKFLPPFHIQLKFFCLLHMIAHSFPYNASRNKNFSMHTPWDKNFLLSKNPIFSQKSQVKKFQLPSTAS